MTKEELKTILKEQQHGKKTMSHILENFGKEVQIKKFVAEHALICGKKKRYANRRADGTRRYKNATPSNKRICGKKIARWLFKEEVFKYPSIFG